MSRPAAPVRQHGTHRGLVSATEQRKLDPRLALDAIVVPASRPAQNLDQAITLARAARSELLILCSHHVIPAEVDELLAKRSFSDAIVVSLPEHYRHDLLEFQALASIKDDLPAACSYYVTDLSAKRNVGLILARMLGWRRIFFLDDDIRDIGYPDLQSTVSMLSRYRTAGMRVTYFPDNSAVCHAHRATGGMQDVFISGAALAVDCQQDVGFFPDIYNEDWLFFYDDAARGQLGGSGRKVTQLRYDPFADPQRAAWQEFGDVLAEGLYALLEDGKGLECATNEYWLQFLEARRRFLEAIMRRSDIRNGETMIPLLDSVEQALKCSIKIDPELFERYIGLWQRDLRDWKQRVARIPRMPTIEDALKALELMPSADNWVTDVAGGRPAIATHELPTIPFTVPDYLALFGPRPDDDGHTTPDWGKKYSARNSRSRHGSPGHRNGLLASARRAFRKPGRESPLPQPAPLPQTQPEAGRRQEPAIDLAAQSLEY
jgi:hypothetical protein